MVKAVDFRNELNSIFHESEKRGLKVIEIRSGDLHTKLGDYPGRNHSMPTCCSVMRSMIKESDQVIQSPPRGNGANLVIRYCLPRT